MLQPEHLVFFYFDSRSGSTLLANTLAQKAGIVFPPESNFIASALRRWPQSNIRTRSDLDRVIDAVYGDPKFRDLAIDRRTLVREVATPTTLPRLLLHVLDIYRNTVDPDAPFVGIKKNFAKHHQQLRTFFRGAHFLGLVRDGRAVFNSKKQSIYSATQKPFESTPSRAARSWCRNVNLIHKAKSCDANSVTIVHYEEMIGGMDTLIKDLCSSWGIPLRKEECPVGYRVSDRYGNKLHENINKTLIGERTHAWRSELHPREIAAFESVAWRILKNEGYELSAYTDKFKKLRFRIHTRLLYYRYAMQQKAITPHK